MAEDERWMAPTGSTPGLDAQSWCDTSTQGMPVSHSIYFHQQDRSKLKLNFLRWELFADDAVETESNPNQETTFLFITTELFLAMVKSSIHRS